jgi:hypothetical protein
VHFKIHGSFNILVPENRRWSRIKPRGLIPQTGKILLPGKNPGVIDCRIVDLSARGACLELPKLYDLPERFEFIHGHTRMICRVAWTSEHRVGVMYEAIKERAMIADA